MAPQGDAHVWTVSKLARVIPPLFPADKFYVAVQGTYYMNRFSAPDPDLHIYDVPEGTPQVRLPKPFLVVEVSATTYRRDTGIKLRAYAAAGIADYWIVNTNERRLEIRRGPEHAGGGAKDWRYAQTEFFQIGQNVSPLAYPQIVIPVADIVP